MKTATKPIEYYLERIKKHLLKKYPNLRFETDFIDPQEVYLYFRFDEPREETYSVTKRAGNIATDALVDAGYSIYVTPR